MEHSIQSSPLPEAAEGQRGANPVHIGTDSIHLHLHTFAFALTLSVSLTLSLSLTFHSASFFPPLPLRSFLHITKKKRGKWKVSQSKNNNN